MKHLIATALVAGTVLAGPANAQDEKFLGIVSISGTEANNMRYIQGAEAPRPRPGGRSR